LLVRRLLVCGEFRLFLLQFLVQFLTMVVVERERFGCADVTLRVRQLHLEDCLLRQPTWEIEHLLRLAVEHYLLDVLACLLHRVVLQHYLVVVGNCLVDVDSGCLIIDDLLGQFDHSNDFMLELTHLGIIEDDQAPLLLHDQWYKLQLHAYRLAAFETYLFCPAKHAREHFS
jgi:hypothetical protein